MTALGQHAASKLAGGGADRRSDADAAGYSSTAIAGDCVVGDVLADRDFGA
jgi:hypothetical protein